MVCVYVCVCVGGGGGGGGGGGSSEPPLDPPLHVHWFEIIKNLIFSKIFFIKASGFTFLQVICVLNIAGSSA